MAKLKVLYLEDSEIDVELINQLFEEERIDYKLYHVNNRRDFLNTLDFADIDVILSDYSLPTFNGSEALALVKAEFADIPFIIVSGVMGEEIAVDLLKAGATDYILKQRIGRLIPSIRRALLETEEKARRLKEENLRKKYDFIINTSKSMFSLVDKDYVYEAVNDAFCRAHNLIRDQVIGKSLAELWGKDVFEKYIKQNFDQSFSDNVVRYQAWFEVPNLGLRCFEVTFYPYKDRGDDISHTVVDTMDITDRQKAEEALIDNEAKYRMLFDNAVEGIFLVKDNAIQASNNRATEYFGYSRKKILGKEPFFFSADKQADGSDSKKKALQIIKKAEEDTEISFEWTFKKLNGQEFLSQVSITSFRLKGETFYQLFIQDITEKVRTAQIQKQLVTAFEQSAELIVIADVDGKLEYANNAFMESTGYEDKDIIGQNYAAVVFADFDQNDLLEIRETVWKERFWSGQVNIKGKNNKAVKVYASVTANRNATGDITHYVVVSRDITEESKIQTYLQQAQKMETIGTLAGGIAHDFNNILTTIIGHSDIALKDLPEDSPVSDDVQQILKAADRAKGLVKQILTFSRQVDNEEAEVELPGLVTEIIKLISATLPENIIIKQHVKAECPTVSADPAHLHQVIMNICTNGVYAMRDKGGTLTISIDFLKLENDMKKRPPDLKKGEYILLKIEDTGKGMEVAVSERIFEPFFTTKPVGEGTGLGLSVVHGIIKNLQGEIQVDSKPGKGSCFSVFIPVSGKK